MNGVKQGTDTQSIPRHEKALLACVPNGKGELPVQSLQTLWSVFFKKVKQNFSIRLGRKRMSPRFKFGSQLKIVKDFAVEHNPQALIFVGDRLLAPTQINDAQTRAAQTDGAIQQNAKLIRAPMPDHGEHSAKAVLRDSFTAGLVEFSGYA